MVYSPAGSPGLAIFENIDIFPDRYDEKSPVLQRQPLHLFLKRQLEIAMPSPKKYHPTPLLLFMAVMLCEFLLPHQPAADTSLARNLALSAKQMEFYYQYRNPEVLPAMLLAFDSQNRLAQGEARLMVGAFLGEIVRTQPEAMKFILPMSVSLSTDGKRTLAWMAHLGGIANEKGLLAQFLDASDTTLKAQIEGTPSRLADWDILKEKAVLQMFWGAFFASANMAYLDKILKAAKQYARLNATGRQNDSSFSVCASAAATLFELAPRHANIRERVAAAMTGASDAEAKTLKTILRQPQ